MEMRRKVLQSYPVVLAMLKCRGYDVDMYEATQPEVSGDMCTRDQNTFIEPIVVRRRFLFDGADCSGYDSTAKDATTSTEVGSAACPLFRFCGTDLMWKQAFESGNTPPSSAEGASRELRVIAEWHRSEPSARIKGRGLPKMRSMYPALMKFLETIRTRCAEASDTDKKALADLREDVVLLYRRAAIPIAEVHFCCATAQKKQPTKMELEVRSLEAMHKTLHTDIMVKHVNTFQTIKSVLDTDAENGLAHQIEKESTRVYQQARRVILIAAGRNERLLSRRADHDDEERTPDTDTDTDNIRMQIFNINNLLYDVRKHMYVPQHVLIDVWQQDKLVQQIKETYHINRLGTSLPIIYTSDAVAKFIGLAKHNLCAITRTNSSSGTYMVYRYCL